DWLRGDTAGLWWWRSLFPGRSLAEAVAHAWGDEPRHVPGALARLHDAGQSADFLNALPGATVAAICTNVARAFALDELREAIMRAVLAERAGHSTGEPPRSPPVQDANRLRSPLAQDANRLPAVAPGAQPIRQP